MKNLFKKLSLAILGVFLVLGLVGCQLTFKDDENASNAPVFSGVEDVVIEKGTQFLPLEGVSVTDVEDGNINLSAVTVDARSVNVNVEGEYIVTYTVYDNDGNKTEVQRKVTVVFMDKVAPELYGVADGSVALGDTSFDELLNVSAVDGIDGEVEVSVEGEVDIWELGDYTITYVAVDAAGNKAEVARKVSVTLGNFEIGELSEYEESISGGEIIPTIASYSLVKFVVVLSGENAVVVPSLDDAVMAGKSYEVNGQTELVFYARIEEALEEAQLHFESEDDFEIVSIQYAFAGAGDHEAPVISRSLTGDVVVPVGVDAQFALAELLSGITAEDNIDGNVTSRLTADLSGINFEEAGDHEVVISVSDTLGNKAELELNLVVAAKRDTGIILDPEFNESENAQIKLSSGAGGSTSFEIKDGMYVLTIVTAGGWASGDSPYLSGITTDSLKAGQYYVFEMDVKADVARTIQIRAGLELWTDPWIENFRDIVKYNVTEDWATIRYIFYVASETSSVGSKAVKFEIQCGSIYWSAAESNNVLYFDNMQFYLLSNDNKAPEIEINKELPTTFAVGAELPDFKEYFKVTDLEDGEIAVTDEMLDLSSIQQAAGTYTITLTVKDSAGKQVQASLDIKLISEADTEGPVVSVDQLVLATLQSFMPIKEGTDLTDKIELILQNVSITDNVDGEITPTLEMFDLDGLNISSVQVGTFNISIQTKDSSGNESNVVSFEVSVVDGLAPVLVGVRDLYLLQGDKFNPLTEVCGYDTNDGIINLTLKNILGLEGFLDAEGNVIGEVGQYQITYNLADAAGNEVSASAVVTVAEDVEFRENSAIDLLNRNQPLGGGTSSTITYADGVGTINYNGAEGWWASFAQLKYTSSVSLVPNQLHKLVITAKAELPREFVIYFVDGAGTKIPGFEIAETGNKLKVGLTNEFNTFVYYFTPTSDSSNASTFEIDLDWESFLLNAHLENTITIKELKIVAAGEDDPTPVVVEPIVLDDFEGYEATEDLVTVWAKRYGGTNYTEGFELVEVEGNKVVKLTYASDNKYLLRYIGTFPKLTSDYKYVRFNAQFAESVDKVEVWLYWSGGQNGLNYVIANSLYSDGYYYFPLSDWNVSGAAVTGFAVGFNYKAGSEAYFDNISFVADLPNDDKTAPVITVEESVLAALAEMEFVEGESLLETFATLKNAISIVDDVDGEIELLDSMLDLGGLDLQNPVAGSYTVKCTASDAAGNEAEYSLSIVIKAAVQKEYEQLFIIDFEDGAGSGQYVNAAWTQEVYKSSWETTSGQMNSRSKDGSKVTNITGGYSMAYKYTYTFDATLENVSKFSIDLGNYFSAADAPIKIALILEDDSILYVVGSASEFYTVAQTTGMDITLEQEFDACNVKAFYISFKSAKSASAYLYLDNITFFKEKVEEPVELTQLALLDFEDGTTGSAYNNSAWKQQVYTSAWDDTSSKMNCREKGGSKVVNMYSGYSMTYKYTYTFDTALENVSKFSIDLGNYFVAADAPIKIALVLEDDSLLYVVGSASEFYTVAQTTGMDITLEKEFDACNVKAFYIVFKSAYNGNAYLYMDNIEFLG